MRINILLSKRDTVRISVQMFSNFGLGIADETSFLILQLLTCNSSTRRRLYRIENGFFPRDE